MNIGLDPVIDRAEEIFGSEVIKRMIAYCHQNYGLLLRSDNGQIRTKGGIFIHLLKKSPFICSSDRRYLFKGY